MKESVDHNLEKDLIQKTLSRILRDQFALPLGLALLNYDIRFLDLEEDIPLLRIDENILFTVLTGHVGTEAATKFIEYHKLFAKWDPNQILYAGKIPAIDQLNKIEAYALLSACVAYLMSHLRKVNFQMNPELERELCGLVAVVRAMSEYHREIVPLGLKTLLLSEKQTTGEIGIVRRLVEEADVVAKLLEVA